MGDGDAAVSVQSSNVVRWEESMATFVLVHGALRGAWCWRRVARLLSQSGHEVFTPTLTGVGERSHLLKPDVNLDTHILDVANEMKSALLVHLMERDALQQRRRPACACTSRRKVAGLDEVVGAQEHRGHFL